MQKWNRSRLESCTEYPTWHSEPPIPTGGGGETYLWRFCIASRLFSSLWSWFFFHHTRTTLLMPIDGDLTVDHGHICWRCASCGRECHHAYGGGLYHLCSASLLQTEQELLGRRRLAHDLRSGKCPLESALPRSPTDVFNKNRYPSVCSRQAALAAHSMGLVFIILCWMSLKIWSTRLKARRFYISTVLDREPDANRPSSTFSFSKLDT